MRLLGNITYWMVMSLSHFQKTVEDRGGWLAAVQCGRKELAVRLSHRTAAVNHLPIKLEKAAVRLSSLGLPDLHLSTLPGAFSLQRQVTWSPSGLSALPPPSRGRLPQVKARAHLCRVADGGWKAWQMPAGCF